MASYTEVPRATGPATVATGNAAAPASAVSWGAIIAGAVGAAVLSLILLLLGTGLGMSSVSPWSGEGIGAVAIGGAAIGWLTFTQIAASGMGGYLAGRLRSRWNGVHSDEVYFRDTAHGFLAWGLATLLMATLLGSAVSGIVGTSAKIGASAVGSVASAAGAAGAGAAAAGAAGSSQGGGDSAGPMGYFIDGLFRKDAAATTPADGSAMEQARSNGATVAEVGRIFANSLQSGSLSQEDARYVASQVAQRTGLSQQDAQKRVEDGFNKLKSTIDQAKQSAKEAADAARKATAYAAIWLFISMLIGAFVASLAATWGGRRRDL